mmetsp:Transcript_19764/g.60912  ORF Transcript_19764/g.60912 Transcript_19764/m.60912 type:complete len:222 (+) Transcript_19764:49-714(+)
MGAAPRTPASSSFTAASTRSAMSSMSRRFCSAAACVALVRRGERRFRTYEHRFRRCLRRPFEGPSQRQDQRTRFPLGVRARPSSAALISSRATTSRSAPGSSAAAGIGMGGAWLHASSTRSMASRYLLMSAAGGRLFLRSPSTTSSARSAASSAMTTGCSSGFTIVAGRAAAARRVAATAVLLPAVASQRRRERCSLFGLAGTVADASRRRSSEKSLAEGG